jgi:hypothetical protein
MQIKQLILLFSCLAMTAACQHQLPVAALSPSGDQTEAAIRFDWGRPLAISDEFNTYTGRPDPAKWSDPGNWGADGCGAGHAGHGRRCSKNSVVNHGIMTMTGDPNGDTGWLKLNLDQQYGRYEARIRSYNVGTSGNEYHPLLLIWPTSEQRVQDGEYDFLENGAPGEPCAEAFIHYPGETPKAKEHAVESNCVAPMSEWHNVAFEWTPSGLKGFINGNEWFSFDEADIAAMPSGHLNIQLDNFYGSGMRQAKLEVDWVRVYARD